MYVEIDLYSRAKTPSTDFPTPSHRSHASVEASGDCPIRAHYPQHRFYGRSDVATVGPISTPMDQFSATIDISFVLAILAETVRSRPACQRLKYGELNLPS